uniref:Malic enzyme n=1 Tax=Trypanosoma congolense (strain IL3000) TaxID=1068625 RepID=G0V0I3_TRYCI|nr:unnamed protein product [Trypanosoma congolense IL3000]
MSQKNQGSHKVDGGRILADRYLNRGTAFTMEQRKRLRILGQIPPAVETLQQQVERVYNQICAYDNPINKYQHLAAIHATNTVLYYATIFAHLEETLPIIYTPTVGEACQKYNKLLFRERGLYFNHTYKGMFSSIMGDAGYDDPEVIVITDGSRILGLGDLGANGVGISIGKCSLYVAGAGIKPEKVIPVILDVGTDNESLRSDPLYLGLREKRAPDDQFYTLLDEFMESVREVWPKAVVQFEDFSNNHCFDMLDRYQKKYRCFNDDIQGTGAVIAAGFLNAMKLSGIEPLKHRIVVFGAGSAAVGVVNNIAALAAQVYNLNAGDVIKTFYLVDTKGLVTTTRGDKLAPHKVPLARTDVSAEDSAKLTTLEDVVRFAKPTTLLGLGGVGPVFTESMVKSMLEYTNRPIILPLSNPTSKAEILPQDAFRWTNGKAIVASGSPFPPTTLEGKVYSASQGNNLYIFPGVGLGCAIAQPSYIPDELLVTASYCLKNLVSEADLQKGSLYPPLSDIHNISANIATDVILEAQRLKVAANSSLPQTRAEVLAYVKQVMWEPVYPEIDF